MGPTKTEKELAVKVHEQEEQLNRYKKRLQGSMRDFWYHHVVNALSLLAEFSLSDVVVAHKKLISEKERLEESLKTIASSIEKSEPKANGNTDASDVSNISSVRSHCNYECRCVNSFFQKFL